MTTTLLQAPEAAPASQDEAMPGSRSATAAHPHRVPGPSSFDERLVPRFRRRRVVAGQRRPRRLWGALRALLLLLLAVALPLSLAVWILTAPQLSFRELRVTAAPQVPTPWIEAQLAPLRGRSLLLLPLAEVEKRLETHPWVAGVAIRKSLPDALEVEVVVRTPVALSEVGERLDLVDATGRSIVPAIAVEKVSGAEVSGAEVSGVAGLEENGLLVVRGAGDSPDDVRRALAVAASVKELEMGWLGDLEAVEVLGEDDFRLHLTGLPFPLVVRVGDMAEKIGILERLLPDVRARFERMKSVDLRFSRKIVLQPEREEAAAAVPSAPSRG